MYIPVFHDDQHGTAIISGAALLNGAELRGKQLADLKIVVSGAGASAIACADFYVSLGVPLGNITMVDSVGVIYAGREQGMNPYKAQFARPDDGARTRADAIRGADVFLGLSKAGLCTPEMLKTMAKNPLIFALANPDPEISYPDAKAARPDAIVATGRCDFPNQVNNVLGFPYIFRGALDVRAKEINEAMKIAAAHALAALAHEPVPDSVAEAYGEQAFRFGPDYIIPKPFDTRVLWWCAPAVAKAAMESGVARLHDRSRRVPRAAAAAHRRRAAHDHAPDRRAREERPQAHRLPRGRQHQGAARLPDRARRGHRAPHPARARAQDPPARRRARPRSRGRRDHPPGRRRGTRPTPRIPRAALPQGRHGAPTPPASSTGASTSA